MQATASKTIHKDTLFNAVRPLPKNKIKRLAQISLKAGTSGYLKEGHLRKIELERQNFIDFVDQLNIKNINKVESLPYRRRLLENEAKVVRHQLEHNWNFDGVYWEPLTICSPKPFYFYNSYDLDGYDYESLVNILLVITKSKVYKIAEDGLDYEIDISEFDKDSCETIYTDKNSNWIIYLSHERTIAFGGLELMNELDKVLIGKANMKNKW